MSKLSIPALLKANVHIVGVSGSEGAAIALWLIRAGHQHLVGHDFIEEPTFAASFARFHEHLSATEQKKLLKELRAGFAKLHFKDTYLAGINEADYVIVPSSWFRHGANKPKLAKLIAQRPQSVFNVYTLLLQLYGGPMIGVSGTSGKGTTVQLLAAMLPKAKTIGGPWQHVDFGTLLKYGKVGGTLIMEVNNRHLTMAKAAKASPAIGVITTITMNHLDDHGGSFAAYRANKWQLLAYQRRGDMAVLNADNTHCRLFARRVKSRARLFSLDSKRTDVDATIREGWVMLRRGRRWQRVASVQSLPPALHAAHFQSDALAALLAAEASGASIKAMANALWSFKPAEGRMSVVKRASNITYINDTAATRPEATVAAIDACAATDLHLIIGGSRKFPQKEQYLNLFRQAAQRGVRTVAIIGPLGDWLYGLAHKASWPANSLVVQCRNLGKAMDVCVARARRAAVKKPQTVLLSPSCESFGEFYDYRQRGAAFTELVKKV